VREQNLKLDGCVFEFTKNTKKMVRVKTKDFGLQITTNINKQILIIMHHFVLTQLY